MTSVRFPIGRGCVGTLFLFLSALFFQCSGGSNECPDSDNDGYRDISCGGSDCDDHNSAIYPAALEICNDGKDNSCDGKTDLEDLQCKKEEYSDGGADSGSDPGMDSGFDAGADIGTDNGDNGTDSSGDPGVDGGTDTGDSTACIGSTLTCTENSQCCSGTCCYCANSRCCNIEGQSCQTVVCNYICH